MHAEEGRAPLSYSLIWCRYKGCLNFDIGVLMKQYKDVWELAVFRRLWVDLLEGTLGEVSGRLPAEGK